jgi:alanine-alpha-ketoisovalerate/valine-pyruvate aminotransferase
MITSLVLGGGLNVGEFDPFGTSICFSMKAASSGVARGITPGSEKLVRNNEDNTNTKSKPLTIGIAILTSLVKKGQLGKSRKRRIKCYVIIRTDTRTTFF